jgi:succinyl-CoA synthetase beta subunit
MAAAGVRTPPGKVGTTVAEVAAAAEEMKDAAGEVVVKSQILAGGRGLGTFTSGLQGGVHVCKASEAAGLAEQMLGQTLVTKQSGPEGKPVNVLYVAEKMKLAREMYFAIVLDRKTAGPMVIACAEGGTSIEDLAERYPDKIVRVPIDARAGMSDEQAATIVEGLGVGSHLEDAKGQIKALYQLFNENDCTMVEVNPLAEGADGKLIAADAKLNFDDNAAFRQKDLFAMRDTTQEDEREVRAAKVDLNYIGLDGEIGCMVNGAGLAMATMDIIKLHGGTPANFLDVGGAADESQVTEAFKILTADSRVKAILVNIFGGIMKCDVIAAGIVAAAKEVGMKVPLVVRLEGTNVEAGKAILAEAALNIISADDLDDAAVKAVHSLA